MATDLTIELEKQVLAMKNGTFTLGQDKGTFEGVVNDFKKAPAWNVKVQSDRITPAGIPFSQDSSPLP